MLPNIGRKKSLSEQAYLVIKESILNNTFKPRDILLEESLAEMLGISRTPLRTALKRLEFEKLVIVNSSKQAVVAEIHLEDMVKVLVFRLAVEPFIARLTCGLVEWAHLAAIEECLAQNETAVQEKCLTSIIACELEFDKLLVAITENEFLADSIAMIHSYQHRFLTLSTTTYQDAPGSLAEHRLILDALRAKNADAAEKRVQEHLRRVASRLGFQLP